MALIAQFSDSFIVGRVTCDRGVYTVSGRVKAGDGLTYKAADPADQRLAVSGSGLPFANPAMAFDGSNMGDVQLKNFGMYEFKIGRPNSYYTHHGKVLVAPHVDLQVVDGKGVIIHVTRVELGKSIPNRSLTGLPGFPKRTTDR
jgi:hypothetical protein